MLKTCVRLFWEMFKIALCVVGGGFAILAVADEVFSRELKWTKEALAVVGALSGEAAPARRLGGSVGAAVWCAMCGASVVRVHDVKETFQALKVVEALGV